MDNNLAVSVEQVSKKYCRSLKRSMLFGIIDIGRNVLGLSSNSRVLRKNEFWAVDKVSFELKRGEILGIIGPNGSGKSTLLKMLNGIFWPDNGKIRIRGRVGALIEVGAGFHSMLTGRENIHINGAILGMTRREIARKFDDIVSFADISDFIDTPVKNYSSGMFVRLGFSVAAHCEPDILLVDEVLAVGDLNFQIKSRQKIKELIGKGVTIILVSHNLHTISHICNRVVVLNKGHIEYIGRTSKAIDIYRTVATDNGKKSVRSGSGEIQIEDFETLDRKSREKEEFKTGEYLKIRIHYIAKDKIINPIANIAIYGENGDVVTGIRNDVDNIKPGVLEGKGYVELEIPELNLLPGIYTLNVTFIDPDGFTFYDRIEGVKKLKISGGKRVNGVVYLPHKWHFFHKSEKALKER